MFKVTIHVEQISVYVFIVCFDIKDYITVRQFEKRHSQDTTKKTMSKCSFLNVFWCQIFSLVSVQWLKILGWLHQTLEKTIYKSYDMRWNIDRLELHFLMKHILQNCKLAVTTLIYHSSQNIIRKLYFFSSQSSLIKQTVNLKSLNFSIQIYGCE